MKKIAKSLLVLLFIAFIILSLMVLAVGNSLAFKYTITAVFVFIFLATLYWIRYSHLKRFKPLLLVFALVIVSYISMHLFIMFTGIYLDASSILWINGQVMTKSDKEKFTAVLSTLEKKHAHVTTRPTYSISFMGRGDYDPRHLHVFRNKGLIYKGCLLGLKGGGLDLDGYQLTEKADRILEMLDNKYQPLVR